MFISSSKHHALQMQLATTLREYKALADRWNSLIAEINEKGGQEFLDNAVMPGDNSVEFSQEEINVLVTLCHPDKHNGRQSAVSITQRLLSMRKK